MNISLPLLHYNPHLIGPHPHPPCKGRLPKTNQPHDLIIGKMLICIVIILLPHITTSSCIPLASPLQPRCDISTIPLEDTMREHCIDSDWLALSLHPANVFRFTYQWKTLPGLCESNFVGTAGEQIASVNILNILS